MRVTNKFLIVLATVSLTQSSMLFGAEKSSKASMKPAPSKAEEPIEKFAPEVSVTELKAMLDAKDSTKPALIVDANSESSFKKGSVPGAIHYSQLAKNLPADKNALIVSYCGGELCTAWQDPAKELRAKGYMNQRHLKAGISGWTKAGMATTPH